MKDEGEREHAWLPEAGLIAGMVLLVAGAGLLVIVKREEPGLAMAIHGAGGMDDARQEELMTHIKQHFNEFKWGVYLTLAAVPVVIGSLWALSREGNGE